MMRPRLLCLAMFALAAALAPVAAQAGPAAGDAAAMGSGVVKAASDVRLAAAHAGHGTVTAGDLEITAFWIRAMLPGQPSAGGYLTITSKGSADRLLSASSPSSGKVELHEMRMANDVMVMRPVDGGLEIPAGGTVELKPGGLHLMFLSPAEQFQDGDTVPVTLRFEKAGTVELDVPVRPASGGHAAH